MKRNFAKKAKIRENISEKCEKNFTKCENFVKIMSYIAATIICLEELVEFSALIAQYLKICHKNNFSSIT